MNKVDEKAAELTEVLTDELGQIELGVLTNYTLADAMREGSKVSKQAHDWGTGDTACAISTVYIAATARGYDA